MNSAIHDLLISVIAIQIGKELIEIEGRVEPVFSRYFAEKHMVQWSRSLSIRALLAPEFQR
jgi:hypothetical protein